MSDFMKLEDELLTTKETIELFMDVIYDREREYAESGAGVKLAE